MSWQINKVFVLNYKLDINLLLIFLSKNEIFLFFFTNYLTYMIFMREKLSKSLAQLINNDKN